MINDLLAGIIRGGNGTLHMFQERMLKELTDDPSILEDETTVWFIARLACFNRYRHTERWRAWLTRNHAFEFKPASKMVPCTRCNGTGIRPEWDPVARRLVPSPSKYPCSACTGTGRVNCAHFEAYYKGRKINESADIV